MRYFLIIISLILLVLIAWLLIGKESIAPNGDNNQGTEYPDLTQDISPIPDESGVISDTQKADFVRQQFARLQQSTKSEEKWSVQEFRVDNKIIPLDFGLEALGVQVSQDLTPYLKQDNWSVDRCFVNKGQSDYAIRVMVKLLPDYQGNLYKDLMGHLRRWEPQMLDDTASVLFPDALAKGGEPQYLDSFRLADPRFLDGARMAPVVQSGKEAEIAYVISGDFIVVGGDSTCVQQIADDLVASD